MANFSFNIAKGKLNWYAQQVEDNSPAGCKLKLVLYKVFSGTEPDAYEDMDTQTAVQGVATTTKCDFTGYVDKWLAAADITFAVDDTNDKAWVDALDITYGSAGGALNNDIVQGVIYFDPTGSSAEGSCIPLAAYDCVITTNGSDVKLTINASGLWDCQ